MTVAGARPQPRTRHGRCRPEQTDGDSHMACVSGRFQPIHRSALAPGDSKGEHPEAPRTVRHAAFPHPPGEGQWATMSANAQSHRAWRSSCSAGSPTHRAVPTHCAKRRAADAQRQLKLQDTPKHSQGAPAPLPASSSLPLPPSPTGPAPPRSPARTWSAQNQDPMPKSVRNTLAPP